MWLAVWVSIGVCWYSCTVWDIKFPTVLDE